MLFFIFGPPTTYIPLSLVAHYNIISIQLIRRHRVIPSPTGSMHISILGSAANALLSSNTKSL
ncbi:hypothetical protein Hanom_Chr00s000006g01613501 [Helianthus anomalus]